MQIKCPSCGFENLEGEDRCQQCFHSLMQRDIPHPQKDDHIQKAILTIPVSDLLTGEDLLVCRPSDSAHKIIEIFRKEKKDCILIYTKKKLVGILSNRDLLFRIPNLDDDLSKIKISDVMTKDPGFVKPEDPIAFAVNKMALGGYRHVPVLREDGTPISILVIRDVLDYLSKSKKSY